MRGLVAHVAGQVSGECHVRRCNKEGCAVSMANAPRPSVLIDLDCEPLGLSRQTRCDYLFVAEDDGVAAWVVPMELKGGRLNANHVTTQLQAGADLADGWLSDTTPFRLVPVLAHKKPIHRQGRENFRRKTVCLRGRKRRIVRIRCGAALRTALAGSADKH